MHHFDKALEPIKAFCRGKDLSFETISVNIKRAYLPLCEKINHWSNLQQISKSLIVGVNGAQGSGKSTLCELMKIILREIYDLNVAVLSIDDLYKTHNERQQMANDIHPLFATRGVPGTHDVELGINILNSLQANKTNEVMLLPRFDKSNDDRAAKEQWTPVKGKVDLILFEGWCVGSTHQDDSELIEPINELESKYDKEIVWRRIVNQQLRNHYSRLFEMLDYLVFIKAPNIGSVFDWRLQQEEKLICNLKSNKLSLSRTMNVEQLKFFMQHFERLTVHNQNILEYLSDENLKLDPNRNCQLVQK